MILERFLMMAVASKGLFVRQQKVPLHQSDRQQRWLGHRPRRDVEPRAVVHVFRVRRPGPHRRHPSSPAGLRQPLSIAGRFGRRQSETSAEKEEHGKAVSNFLFRFTLSTFFMRNSISFLE